MKLDKNKMLFKELVSLIEDGKRQLSFAANATITITYWRVGKSINDDVLKNKRAGYGKQIVETVSQQLTEQYGNNYGVKNLRRMMQFAIELKLGKFKVAYKVQMELYLRWLEEKDRQKGEAPPLGLILCAEGNQEQIALLQLEKAGIKVAEYLTELPNRELLKQKLHRTIEQNRKRLG